MEGLSESSNDKNHKQQTFYRKREDVFELLFVGDTSFGENYQQKISIKDGGNILTNYGYEYPLKQVKSIMLRADFIVANLETPITNIKESPFEGIKDYLHWTDVEMAPSTLINHKVSLLSLANNHTFDFGKAGFEQTLEILKKNAIPSIGAGINIDEAKKPFIVEINFESKKFKFAILAAFEELPSYRKKYDVYADDKKPGIVPLNLKSISDQVIKLKEKNPDLFVIFYPHWGSNYKWREEEQIKISNELISCGVDLIIGHGAHMIQEVEKINEKWIIYSIGNFMFNSPGRYERMKAPPYSFISSLNISLSKNKFDLFIKLYPIVTDNKLTNYQPRFLNQNEFNNFLSIMAPNILIKQPKPSDIDIKKDELGFYIELPVLNHQIKKVSIQPKWIGMVYNEPRENTLENHIYPWIARAFVIDQELEKHNYKLISFLPKNFNPTDKTVTGFMLDHGQFKQITVPIPKVIYNFHLGKTNRNIYQEFENLALEQGIDIYPTKSIRKLTSDKLRSAELIAELDKTIIPKTEIYEGMVSQLQSYLQLNTSVFIKPRFGNMGNGIYVLKQENNNFILDYYFKGKKKIKSFKNLAASLSYINENINEEKYIIQESIDILRYQGLVFNIRTIVFQVHNKWQFLSELIVADEEKVVSNLYQGGRFYSTKKFLLQLFPSERVSIIMDKIKKISIDIANFINERYDNKINEMSFDMLMDKNERFYIAELNVKPGLAGEPMKYSNYFLMTEEENYNYETLTIKHGEYLAKSLLDRCITPHQSKVVINKKYWFEDIQSNIIYSSKEIETISKIILNCLINRQYSINSLPVGIQRDTPQLLFLTVSDNLSIGKTYFNSGGNLLETINGVLKKTSETPSSFNIQMLKLDIVQDVTVMHNHDIRTPLRQDRSLYGIAFDEEIGLAYLPEEIVSKTIINGDGLLQFNAIIKSPNLTANQKKGFSKTNTFTIFRFKLQSYAVSRTISAPLYRGHGIYNEINNDMLLSSAILAGKYLEAAVKKDGQFIYEYLPKKDETSNRYNVLRHAGTVYSMLELFELTKDEKLMKAIKLALSNLLNRAKSVNIKGQNYLCIIEKDFAKLGANALTILALSKYMSITNDTSHLAVAKKLARWMKHAQEDTGAFLIQKFRFSKKINTNFVSDYYPGEAIFSLVRLYQVDPNESWLDIASNAAKFIINIRDKNKKISQLEHDHWLLYGLNELYKIRPDPIYIEHTQKICQAILRSQYTKDEPIDYKGSYYNPPRSTPAATRSEGLCAAYRLLNSIGYEKECKDILEAIKLNIRFQLQTQFQPERTLYLINPQRALGGFSKSLTDYSIRIDYVQHNLSSLIGLYKILK